MFRSFDGVKKGVNLELKNHAHLVWSLHTMHACSETFFQ